MKKDIRDLQIGLFIFISIYFSSIFLFNIYYKDNRVIEENKYGMQDEIITSDSISIRDSIKQFIKQMNLTHPDIVYAQAILESGNFSSKLFIDNNNMFGMKEAMVRNTVALGTKNGYAYYKNWEHSIIDYALYQSTYYHNSKRDYSRQDYLEKLARTYASDPNYIPKVLDIINKEKWQ